MSADSTPVAPTIVILGATGDLTARLLFPAIHHLAGAGRLPAGTRIVASGIEDWTTEQCLEHLRDGVTAFGGGVDDRAWNDLAGSFAYVAGDLVPETGKRLAALIGGPALFYLALPPSLFATAATMLGEAGLATETTGWRRLAVEKPFGTDTESARALQTELDRHWRDDQILRVDHFLGKDTVQNAMVFRFANRFVDAIWRSQHIEHVQITAAETLGLEGRWRYYDGAGALRDMLQNHLMQLLAITAMEPPDRWEPSMIQARKADLLRSVVTPAGNDAVRGRYTAGVVEAHAVDGYLDEPNIPASSTTETYAALRLTIDTPRWTGVPFLIRSGKRMSGNLTEIALKLRAGDNSPLPADSHESWIVLRLRPDETIEIDAIAKRAGLGIATEAVRLSATDSRVDTAEYQAYEQLVLDALDDHTGSFVSGAEAAEAWRIVQPVLDAWHAGGEPSPYAAGTDGPDAPTGFLPDGAQWRTVAK